MAEDPKKTRRRTPRRRTLFGGILVFGAGELSLDCAVRDLSETGARIRIASLARVDAPAILVIPSLDVAYEVAFAWGRGTEFGLDFVRTADLTAPTTELERSAGRLWRTRRR